MLNCSQCNKSSASSDDIFVIRGCNHVFCHKCLCNYIKSHIECKIQCLYKNCVKTIPDQIIRKCLSNSEIDIYEQKSLCKSSKHARKCLTSTCPTIMFIEDDNSIFQCQFCEQPNCLKCKRRHYPNQCGLPNQNEEIIEAAAKVAMSQNRRKALEEQMKNESHTPNPESFECVICCSFILPRAGIIFRNCFHSCCENCFKETFKEVNFIGNFKCPMCNIELCNQEIIMAVGKKEMIEMLLNEIAQKMFCCKFPNCCGMWDNQEGIKGHFICPLCKHSNCLECKDIHEGLSCEAFRETDKYRYGQIVEKNLTSMGVQCKCGRLLIQKGGCGALHCDKCGRQICAFTKKLAGNSGPDTNPWAAIMKHIESIIIIETNNSRLHSHDKCSSNYFIVY